MKKTSSKNSANDENLGEFDADKKKQTVQKKLQQKSKDRAGDWIC